ncbi:MAG: hypothetical protein Q4G69_03470 [Planctomycetia bacterium]|nr:hypothetical protein [Planctomycetia bacterium]
MLNSEYKRIRPFWDTVHDCYLGTAAVKNSSNSLRYLPLSAREKKELEECPDKSTTRYEFRKKYAIYENIFKPVIDDSVGLMQRNPARIAFGARDNTESPEEVRDLDIYGNHYKDGLKGLKARLNFHQTLYGRYGLLLDLVENSMDHRPRFIISEYPAVRILDGEIEKEKPNSENRISWILLDESAPVFDRSKKAWVPQSQFRLLALDARTEYYQIVFSGPDALASWRDFDFKNPKGDLVYPSFRDKRLPFIPMTVCNVNKLGLDQWQEPPFLDVAHIAIGIYQIDSLYKKALWNFASPTLSVANADKPNQEFYLGDAIWPRTNGDHPVSVSLLETSGAGLAEMRSAKEEMKNALKYSSIRELLDGAGANASSEAIQLRAASGTAGIAAIDQTGGRAIEEQLIFAALWAGASEKEAGERISYCPDTSYLENDYPLQAIVSFIQANSSADRGDVLLSQKNIYSILEKTLPNTLSTFEDNELQKKGEKSCI